MTCPANSDVPTILFGAFDRHNFGDLLFPHIAAALLSDRNLRYAGLLARDLRCYGGHQVRALAHIAAEQDTRPVNLVHVGGELLTCDAWQAAVMLLPADQVQAIIARLRARPQEKQEWASRQLGLSARAPYCVSRLLLPQMAKMVYVGVGGVALDESESAFRAEVLASLKSADFVSVRDRQTQAQLESAGIPVRLIPDPAVMVAELFGSRIHQRTQASEIARILGTFPHGYIAVQFSADFSDDATLDMIAAQLEQAAMESGYGVVFFRAGAAPWHDDLSCFLRVASRMCLASVTIFKSLNLWDICALIANSRVYCGSSLHGRIVAMAFALPRFNFLPVAQENHISKQAAFAATWDATSSPGVVGVHQIALGICQALAEDLDSTCA